MGLLPAQVFDFTAQKNAIQTQATEIHGISKKKKRDGREKQIRGPEKEKKEKEEKGGKKGEEKKKSLCNRRPKEKPKSFREYEKKTDKNKYGKTAKFKNFGSGTKPRFKAQFQFGGLFIKIKKKCTAPQKYLISIRSILRFLSTYNMLRLKKTV